MSNEHVISQTLQTKAQFILLRRTYAVASTP